MLSDVCCVFVCRRVLLVCVVCCVLCVALRMLFVVCCWPGCCLCSCVVSCLMFLLRDVCGLLALIVVCGCCLLAVCGLWFVVCGL